MAVTVTDWIQTVAAIYFAYQQNRIFKQQNQIFAGQVGQGALQTNASPWWWLFGPFLLIIMTAIGFTVGRFVRAKGRPSPNSNDQTDWKKLYLEENQQRTHYQQEYAITANRVLELEGKAKETPPTLAQRLFDLAARYRKAAREFHKQNPQPPAPPALTAWAAKANGWQKVNFHAELQRAHAELAAEG
jgi:hypothetical protein